MTEEFAAKISVLTIADLDAVDELMKRYSSTLGFLPRAALEDYLQKPWVLGAKDPRTVDSLATSCMRQIVTDSALHIFAYRRPAGARASLGGF